MRRLVMTAAAAVAVAVSGTAIALPSIPDGKGVIHGCYTVKTGALRVIDTGKGQSCVTGQHALTWSQTGPRGPVGPSGQQGPAGVSGYSVARCTVAEDSTGNFFVASSSGGTCSVTGDDHDNGSAVLVCPAEDKAISWASATSAGGAFAATDAMPNADDTGYQYLVGSQEQNPEPTDIAVTCANAS